MSHLDVGRQRIWPCRSADSASTRLAETSVETLGTIPGIGQACIISGLGTAEAALLRLPDAMS